MCSQVGGDIEWLRWYHDGGGGAMMIITKNVLGAAFHAPFEAFLILIVHGGGGGGDHVMHRVNLDDLSSHEQCEEITTA